MEQNKNATQSPKHTAPAAPAPAAPAPAALPTLDEMKAQIAEAEKRTKYHNEEVARRRGLVAKLEANVLGCKANITGITDEKLAAINEERAVDGEDPLTTETYIARQNARLAHYEKLLTIEKDGLTTWLDTLQTDEERTARAKHLADIATHEKHIADAKESLAKLNEGSEYHRLISSANPTVQSKPKTDGTPGTPKAPPANAKPAIKSGLAIPENREDAMALYAAEFANQGNANLGEQGYNALIFADSKDAKLKLHTHYMKAANKAGIGNAEGKPYTNASGVAL